MKTTILLKLASFLLFPVLLNAQTQIGNDLNAGGTVYISLSGDGNTVAVGDPHSTNYKITHATFLIAFAT